MVTVIPITTYLVDAFPLYSASVSAARNVLTSFTRAWLPLVGPSLYARLGLDWGNSLLGFIALVFSLIQFVFIFYSERIRKKSRPDLKA